MSKTRRILLWICVSLAAAILCTCGIIGFQHWNRTYVLLCGDVIRRDVTQLDLHGKKDPEIKRLSQLQLLQSLDLRDTGITGQDYLQLREALPQCTILWSVPFQNSYLPHDTTSVTVTTLSAEDVAQLKFMESLERVNATGCWDYDALLLLKKELPSVKTEHTVKLSGIEYPLIVTDLTVANADPAEVSAILPHLTYLQTLTFTGKLPDNETIFAWKEAYPHTKFIWNFEVCGVSVTSLDTHLYLNDIPMESVEAVESSLKYFYDLQWVEMCRCGIPSEEMDALGQRHPETRFIWTVHVGTIELRTDVQVFMPYKFGYRTIGFHDGLTKELKYCTDIICMDLGHMGVTDYSFLHYMPKMQYLILADTKGSDFSFLPKMKDLKYLEIFITSINDLELLTGLTKLEDLNLSYTYPPSYEPLSRMPWLKNLWLVGPSWRISYRDRQLLYQELPNTYIKFDGKGSVCGHWRNLPNYYAMRDLLGMPYFSGDEE